MPLTWNGYYYSGQDAVQHRALVSVLPSALELQFGGRSQIWPYAEIRKAGEIGPGDPIRLERGGETLVVADAKILNAIVAYASHLTPVDATSLGVKLALLAIASIGAAGALLYFGAPALAGAVASAVPVDWEEQLGAAAFSQLAPESRQCGKEAARAATAIVERLHAVRNSPYRFRVAIVDDPEVNAFAMPGGFLAIHSGLLEKTRRPEELAGVLAHEMEHVIQRHSTRAIVRELSLRALIALVIGDVNGAVALAGSLGSLHFQRRDEEDADRAGMERVMAARIDPEGMVEAFRMLDEHGDKQPRVARYLSTHPQVDDRVRALERIAATFDGRAEPIEAGGWKRIASACKP